MGRWEKKTFKLKQDLGWTAKPGNNVFAADRGAVHFEYPQDWITKPADDGSIRFHDKEPPDDDCTLAMSIMYLNDEIDWSGLPLNLMVRDLSMKDKRPVLWRGDVIEIRRERLYAAWTEIKFMDPKEVREAFSRMCLAKWSNVQTLITFDYWRKDEAKCAPVWDNVMESLVICDYVELPFLPTRRKQ